MDVSSKSATPTSAAQFGTSDSAGLPDHGIHTFILGAGCFWCMDTIYRKTVGVSSVVSGYIGGHTPNPDYREVCGGTTGHAEAVAVTFDASVVPADVILDMFFTGHDPTTLNRQGYDVGTQYRSAIYWTTPGQEKTARELTQAYGAELARRNLGAITTELRPAEDAGWFYAEDVHQQYLARNPLGYRCHANTGVSFPS